jgi:hypothetical protein
MVKEPAMRMLSVMQVNRKTMELAQNYVGSPGAVL